MLIVKTRKEHLCVECVLPILKGTKAITEILVDASTSFEGSQYKGYFHPKCWETWAKTNTL